MSNPVLRAAAVGDAADIHALMLGMAGDLPLAVETLEQEEALYAALRKILAFGQSWVALDGERIAGFALVDSAEVGRHWGENELLTLRYAAGAAQEALVAKVLERKVPVAATVRDGNRTGLAGLLLGAGFVEGQAPVGERRFRYEP